MIELTDKYIEEGEVTIGEWMGVYDKYYEDWNLLMMVIDKIEMLGQDLDDAPRMVIEILGNLSELSIICDVGEEYMGAKRIIEADFWDKRDSVFFCIVEFIHLYNEGQFYKFLEGYEEGDVFLFNDFDKFNISNINLN